MLLVFRRRGHDKSSILRPLIAAKPVMNILAVETSTERCSVALLWDGKIALAEELAGQRHSEMLMGMIDGLLEAQDIKIGNLDGIAFGAGPGSFTGLRIACGVVQGLAFGAHKRVVGISSLLALAEASDSDRVIAALDARMGETYVGAFERDAGQWREVIDPCLADAKSLPRVGGGGWCGVGSGFDTHGYLANQYNTQLATILTARLPGAHAIVSLAAREFAAGRAIDPQLARPLYIRDKVALTAYERATGRSPQAIRS
jgi:tRNA threonylcarbamoyladenosine biosynthesis protein TsaB